MFSDTLDEFDDSRQVVQDLIEEYEACETPDYVNYVSTFAISNNERLLS
jgi:tubulin gamma